MKFELSNLTRSNWILMLLLLLCATGLANLYSISLDTELGIFKKQMTWVVIGIVVATVISFIKPANIKRLSMAFYIVCFIFLVLTLVFGKTVSGSQSWFQLGPVSIQPSEFMKIAIIVAIANYYDNHLVPLGGYNLKSIAKPLLLLLLPVGVVLMQPDTGTALTIFLIGISMILFLGISRASMAKIIIILLISVIPVWHLGIKEYQKQRIYSFLGIHSDPHGVSYNLIQSQIAIGSGMGYGKGFSLGSQSNLSFLPANHTDFAFSVIAEEWGFRGSVFVLLLYFSIVLLILTTSMSYEENFPIITCFGIAAMFFWHGVINIAMITGLLPTIGTPLFLISYGGSSVLTAFIGIGIVLCLRKK